jgi:hypothetical protein
MPTADGLRTSSPDVTITPTASWAARLDRLEAAHRELARTARRWRLAALAATTALGLGTLAGAAAAVNQAFDQVEAKSFVLRDDAGKFRATLAMRPDGTPGLALLGTDGGVRLSLDLGAGDVPSVNLHDNTGVVRAAVAVHENQSPGLALFDGQGTLRASIDVGDDHTSGINVFDPQGVIRGAMAVRPDGTPGFGLFDGQGQVRQSFELADERPQP